LIMVKNIKSPVLRYGLPLVAFALILLVTFTIPRLFAFNLDLTSLIIALMIATAWYFGRGPGLMIAIVFEVVLEYFSKEPYSAKFAIIVFNRLALFISLVLFASARREAEKRLREQRELLKVTLSSIGDAVIATDINGIVNFVNPVAETLTGWRMSEAAGKPLHEVFQIVNEETHETVESPFSTIRREGNIVGLANHTVLIARNGEEFPIEDSGAPIRDTDGKIIGVIIVFHDVSERRRIEKERERLLESERAARGEAEEANRLKDEFLATVSHELRTPLNAILGWTSALRDGRLKEEVTQNALDIIERNAKSQAEIIEDILDVSRIVTGKLNINTEPVNPEPIILSAIDSLRPAAEAKAITLKLSLEPKKGLIAGDPDRLRQVVWNLLSNAIKFTPQNGQIEVRLARIDSELELKVIDNGMGISKEFLPYVFDRFRQADASTTRAESGLGLGLSIARYLIEMHGGTISAESEGEGKGTTFTVRLPVAAIDKTTVSESNLTPESKQLLEADKISTEGLNFNGLRILVVDDEPDTLEILRIVLKQYGANVRIAVSAADALVVFHEWKPDLLISDLGMPGEDGFSLISKIRALTEEDGGNIPAAALTAYARDEDRIRAINAGFQIHISKPIEPNRLAAKIAELAEIEKAV
jgi:PAS domain S-box-containing protein